MTNLHVRDSSEKTSRGRFGHGRDDHMEPDFTSENDPPDSYIHSFSQLSGGVGPHMFMWYQGSWRAIVGG